MVVRSLEQAKEIVGDRAQLLAAAVLDAVRNYYQGEEYASIRARHGKRSAASDINDDIWTNLKTRLQDDPDVTFHEFLNGKTMIIAQSLRFRVKKFGRDMRPRNNMNQAVLDFVEQRLGQLRFPGMEPPTGVDLGYQLMLPAEIDARAFIRCPKSQKNHNWLWELEEPAGAAVVPLVSQPQQEADGGRRVKPRRADSDVEETPGESVDGPSTD